MTFGADRVGGFLGRLGVDVEHGQLRALACEPERDSVTDAGARAGDGGEVGSKEVGHGGRGSVGFVRAANLKAPPAERPA